MQILAQKHRWNRLFATFQQICPLLFTPNKRKYKKKLQKCNLHIYKKVKFAFGNNLLSAQINKSISKSKWQQKI